MKNTLDHSDSQFLSELHRLGPKTVQEIGESFGVTATAVRQRLSRLQAQGFVSRVLIRSGRGRPHYTYEVTPKGTRELGDNYTDLALILWHEFQRIDNPEVREIVRNRVRDALVAKFGSLAGTTMLDRVKRLRDRLVSHGYDVEVSAEGRLPILRENNCPYQELAEDDRGICDLEQDVFRRVLGADVRLSQCCMDGHRCCEFEIQESSSSSQSQA